MGTFAAPTRIVAARGSLREGAALLDGLGDGPVALVCDRGVAEVGLLARIRAAAGFGELVECRLADPDPRVVDVEQMLAEAQAAGCDRVLGVGGGSALGAAKAVAISLTNELSMEAMEGRDAAPNAAAGCLAIPTTAGSGSEVSNAFVLKRADGSPLVARGTGYEPRVALLDGAVLESLGAQAMVYAGLDALSHAFEALWVHGATRFSDALAVAAAETLIEVLPRAIVERGDKDLQTLIEASAMANLACGSAGLGLVHALSASSLSLPHGYQNGVLLPHVAEFNAALADVRLERLDAALPGLYERLEFGARFAPGEVDAAAMAAAAADHVFNHNNRRPAGEEDLLRILVAAGAAR